MNIKLFTHTDLDGVSCAVVAYYAYGEENVDITYCDYENVNENIEVFINSGNSENYDKVFVTDISVSEKIANLINDLTANNFQLIDHHATAKWLNKYNWCLVNDEEDLGCGDKIKSSGTTLFYEWLEINENVSFAVNLMPYIESVRRYDTWDWKRLNDSNAKKLNDLFWLLGRARFVNKMMNSNNLFGFDKESELLLEIEQYKIDKYIENKESQMFESTLYIDKKYNVGVVYAEQYTSQLGNDLAEENKHLDFIVLIDVGSGKISYRTIHDYIDLSKIAKFFGGGGHPKASGSPLNVKNRKNLWRGYLDV